MGEANEIEARAYACLREVAATKVGGPIEKFWDTVEEACAIVALLPEPIDPDLIEARKISDQFTGKKNGDGQYSIGNRDSEAGLQAVLAAIKRGRTLAQAKQGEEA